MRKGFTVIDVSVALAVVAAAGGLFILSAQAQDAAGRTKRASTIKAEEKALSDIFKALAVYGDSNKDWYPGLTSTGKYMQGDFKGKFYGAAATAKNAEEAASGAGCSVAAGNALAQAILLEEETTLPTQWISPAESDAEVKAVGAKRQDGAVAVGPSNNSHAMLAYGRPKLKAEWKSTTSNQSIILASRLIFGEKKDQFSSLRTKAGSGQWRGVIVRNDGSTEYLTAPMGEDQGLVNLKYGAVILTPSGDTASVTGLFGKHTDLANFDAADKSAQLGSAADGVKEEKKEAKPAEGKK